MFLLLIFLAELKKATFASGEYLECLGIHQYQANKYYVKPWSDPSYYVAVTWHWLSGDTMPVVRRLCGRLLVQPVRRVIIDAYFYDPQVSVRYQRMHSSPLVASPSVYEP